jgi:hypothetical protein
MRAALALVVMAGQAMAEPAELPPPEFKGQQYVDSRGCLFLRAGDASGVIWVPRVTRGGAPICDQPPSGQRVPVAGEETGQALTGPMVALGAYASRAEAEAVAKRAAASGFLLAVGKLAGDASGRFTVLAGPFASLAEARQARRALRNAGFPEARLVRP